MQFYKDLISVVVPAFNQPDYLKRLLHSIIRQTYRPIEIIVSDDCSKMSLERVVNGFNKFTNQNLRIKFYRNSKNLGVMGNFRFAVEQASGKYLLPFAHDNRLTDDNYFAESINIMQITPDCHISIANSKFENSDRKMLGSCEGGRNNSWRIFNGGDFISKYRRGGLNWSQATIVDHEVACCMKAYDEPFMISPELSRKLKIAQDNISAFVFVLSAVGSVALTQKCVCEIGVPKDSYSRTKIWQDTKKRVKFVIFFNIYTSGLKGKYARACKKMAFKQAMEYVDYIRDIKIIKYYNWSAKIFVLVALSFIKIPWFQLRQFNKKLRHIFKKDSSPTKIKKSDIETIHFTKKLFASTVKYKQW